MKKLGALNFGIPVFLVITGAMVQQDVGPISIALWCTIMGGFIGYSLCDNNVFKK